MDWAIFIVVLPGVFSLLQEFSVQPSSVLVLPGSNATLSCLVLNMGAQAECRWQKDGKPVGIFPGKYSLPISGSKGDCSLRIAKVDAKLDGGSWECQVTPSNINMKDALTSFPAKLSVQKPPSSISVYSSNMSFKAKESIKVKEDIEVELHCLTDDSNPAPTISWKLGETMLNSSDQSNTLNLKSTWESNAILQHTFTRADDKKALQCIVTHPAYPDGQEMTSVALDVLFPPSVQITRVSSPQLQEGVGSLSLTCTAKGNPAPSVFWVKGKNDWNPIEKKVLELKPVRKEDSGNYFCFANNSLGRSEAKKTSVDVLYSPVILSTDPLVERQVSVGSRTVLSCSGEGNPGVSYQWKQRLPSGQVLNRSLRDELVIEKVSYRDDGEYRCSVFNTIGRMESEGVRIEVFGKPQFGTDSGTVRGIEGEVVTLDVEICSDPKPATVTWQWAEVVLPLGSELDGRFKVELLSVQGDCYISRLTISSLTMQDTGEFIVKATNKYGEDRVVMLLLVEDSLSLTPLISAAFALLIIFLTVVLSLLISHSNHRLCIRDADNNYDPSPATSVNLSGVSEQSLIPYSTKV